MKTSRLLRLLLPALLSATSSARLHAAPESLPVPIAEWTFDRIDKAEFAGGGQLAVPGAVAGNVTVSADKFGKAASFQPADGGIINVSLDLNEHISGPISVVAWVQLRGKQNDNGTIFRAGRALSLRVQGPKLNVSCDNDWKGILTGNSVQLIGGWSLLAAVNDGKSVKLYLDGVEIGSRVLTTVPKYVTPLTIGSRVPDVTKGEKSYMDVFNGSIKSVAIYNRALTPEELKALMSALQSPDPS